MVGDYISREAAIKALSHGDGCGHVCKHSIERIPAADVVEVRHGRWIWELADNGWANHICSECGYTKNTDIHVRLGYYYCPICGAKMDGWQEDV